MKAISGFGVSMAKRACARVAGARSLFKRVCASASKRLSKRRPRVHPASVQAAKPVMPPASRTTEIKHTLVSRDRGAASSLSAGPAGGDYRLLPLSHIRSAADGTRIVCEHLEELASSIEGNSKGEGVGLLVPVLVRLEDDGSHRVIDGERRLRACRMIAERSQSGDFRIPALVFAVSERVALLMRHVATLEHDDPKPYEIALSYQRLRNACRDELGEDAASVRQLAAYGRHGKSQVADYLRIADCISADVIRTAGLVSTDGTIALTRLAALSKKQLHDAANCDTVAARAAALKSCLSGRKDDSAPASDTDVNPRLSLEERRAEIATRKAFSLKLREPAQLMDPSAARAIIENELAPAIIAMVDRAHGSRDAEGYYADVSAAHGCVVIPGEIESLTVLQLTGLEQTLAALVHRVSRARAARQ